MNRLVLIIAAAALTASHTGAWRFGWVSATDRLNAAHAAVQAALEDDLAHVSLEARRAQAKLMLAETRRAELVERLEDEARNDPDAGGRVPDADSLRRLQIRWGGAGQPH